MSTLKLNSILTGPCKLFRETCFQLQELLIEEIKLSANKANLMLNLLTALVLRFLSGRNGKIEPISFAT